MQTLCLIIFFAKYSHISKSSLLLPSPSGCFYFLFALCLTPRLFFSHNVILALVMKMNEYISKSELHKIVCQNIKKYRKLAKLTQQDLSEKIDISYDYFRQLESEKGQKHFSFYTLYKLSKALNVPMDSFIKEN